MAAASGRVNNALRPFLPPRRLLPEPCLTEGYVTRMSVDPDQPSSPDAIPPKTAADPAGENAESLRLKRRFKKGGAESDEEEKPDQTIQLLSTLLQDLIAKKEQPGAVEAETKTAKYHRLSKTGTGGSGATPELASTGTSAPSSVAPMGTPETETAVSGSSSAPPPLPAVTFRPAPVREPGFRWGWAGMCFLGLAVFAGLTWATIAYFRPASSAGEARTKSPPAMAGAWNDAMLTQLDQALAADQAGDLKGAQRLAAALKKPETPSPPGLDLYLASLTTRFERAYDVEADLLRASSNASPEEAAAIYERLAFNFSRTRDFVNAVKYYAAAGKINPFSAPSFYHRGEALRHLGHFQDAVASYRRAIDRIPTGQPENESLRECVNLKLRLALLEQGHESEFQDQLTEQVKAPSPSGYWLLTAATVALQHKNLSDAAAFLGRARDALGATQFDSLLNDYFFRAYADRKELADFFPPDPAARRAKLVPTMTYTVEP